MGKKKVWVCGDVILDKKPPKDLISDFKEFSTQTQGMKYQDAYFGTYGGKLAKRKKKPKWW